MNVKSHLRPRSPPCRRSRLAGFSLGNSFHKKPLDCPAKKLWFLLPKKHICSRKPPHCPVLTMSRTIVNNLYLLLSRNCICCCQSIMLFSRNNCCQEKKPFRNIFGWQGRWCTDGRWSIAGANSSHLKSRLCQKGGFRNPQIIFKTQKLQFSVHEN